MEEEGDIVFAEDTGGHSEGDDLFDMIVGKIQDILIQDEFTELVNNFMRDHCQIFENSEENKLEYTTVFQQFHKLIESYLEKELTSQVEDFSMEGFMELLSMQEDPLEGDVFDLLYSFSNFEIFKENILAFKNSINNKNGDFSAIQTKSETSAR
eukprot:TRINITY_DN15120_c0_g1_i1.p1 TRINITY_DN15120_c0_g1~~TRINITY_DN15120_c0_g1_i1.p1  ORF type:complete len:154 (+),score=32.80 TRINITY_DN15120_c0_g1_i1:269-730(+)